ncbi:hypothetical protein ONZ45_g18317 [Pleurotus djamor]|nr:hypothetical protein ONZ45_g18317 [Pleurotus djamor]
MFFHTTTSDTLWFEGWTPTSAGAVVGACFGLFFLAVFERFIAAMKGLSEAHWKVIKTQRQAQTDKRYLGGKGDSESQQSTQLRSFLDLRRLPAFSLSRDLSRAVLHAAQVTLAYLLMLAVMTYQVFFVIAIVLGAGAGELVFGRFASGSSDEGH